MVIYVPDPPSIAAYGVTTCGAVNDGGVFAASYNATAGSGVEIYLLDSGLLPTHNEFDARVVTSLAANFDNNSTSSPAWADCNGHGTFVASQSAGNSVGVASGAAVIPLRVFTCGGSASLSSLLSATDYALTTSAARGRRGVINFSGVGGASATLDALPDKVMLSQTGEMRGRASRYHDDDDGDAVDSLVNVSTCCAWIRRR